MTYIGSFSVDSGQAIVGDPCYLDNWENWDDNEPFDNHTKKKGQYGYLGACGVTLAEGYGILGNGSSVAFTNGYWDGVYPVYAKFNDEDLKVNLEIDLEDDDEE